MKTKQKTRQVIRIEHRDGWGMFRSYDANGNLRPHGTNLIIPSLMIRHEKFNTPDEDGLDFSTAHLCAYKSIEHVHEWVRPDEFRTLIDKGYKVFLIKVRDWQEGGDNVIFLPEDIISKENVSSLFLTKTGTVSAKKWQQK